MYKSHIILTLMCAGCATAASQIETTQESIPEIIVATDEPKTVMKEYSASELLERGFMFFHQKLFRDAAENFRKAIGTGNLNDAGRALAYWHMGLCWTELNEEDNTMDALFSFVMVAQDILDIREIRQYAVAEGEDFVGHFKLMQKLAWARAYINFTWASRGSVYGRSQDNPVLAHNIEELEFFVGMVKGSCEGECDFQRSLLHEDGAVVKPHTEMITIRGQDTDQFFIVVPE
ncbi:MAG: hypothetical protein ACXAC5_03915 [Promethearchaeota archaeon]|jgi:hypothetical protein